jgi:hypothetical protein
MATQCLDGYVLNAGVCTACHTNTGVKACSNSAAVTNHIGCLATYYLNSLGTCTTCGSNAN